MGSWVREAAIRELPGCLVLMCSLDPDATQLSSSEQAGVVQLAVQALLKQSVERIARVREVTPCAAATCSAPLAIYVHHCINMSSHETRAALGPAVCGAYYMSTRSDVMCS